MMQQIGEEAKKLPGTHQSQDREGLGLKIPPKLLALADEMIE
jgi:hypothetical protein